MIKNIKCISNKYFILKFSVIFKHFTFSQRDFLKQVFEAHILRMLY